MLCLGVLTYMYQNKLFFNITCPEKHSQKEFGLYKRLNLIHYCAKDIIHVESTKITAENRQQGRNFIKAGSSYLFRTVDNGYTLSKSKAPDWDITDIFSGKQKIGDNSLKGI